MDKRTKTYLAKKQMGGEINQRGNEYEKIVACYRIMQLMLRYPHNFHEVSISSQYPGFVDDIYIKCNIPGDEKNIFHQLKTSKSMSWGNGLRSLHDDFKQQGLLMQLAKKSYHLYLVVSEVGVHNTMIRTMPTKLRKHSGVVLFPWYGSLNTHCIYHIQLRNLAQQLCAFPDADKINAMVKCIYACWGATNKKNILLSEIVNCVWLYTLHR